MSREKLPSTTKQDMSEEKLPRKYDIIGGYNNNVLYYWRLGHTLYGWFLFIALLILIYATVTGQTTLQNDLRYVFDLTAWTFFLSFGVIETIEFTKAYSNGHINWWGTPINS